jgi:hypothetical protein
VADRRVKRSLYSTKTAELRFLSTRYQQLTTTSRPQQYPYDTRRTICLGHPGGRDHLLLVGPSTPVYHSGATVHQQVVWISGLGDALLDRYIGEGFASRPAHNIRCCRWVRA